MKIKKVEISSFRAFNKVENSTFDFTTKEGEPASFISIYAPNGFGKTSFYDAVEWCVTGQIQRFHKNYTEYDKLAKENRKENKANPYFLKHHYSEKNSVGFVKVLTDKEEIPRNLSSSVYNFKSKGERIFFKDVILSQELIDSFLKEVKAEERYKNFVESFPDLNQYNIKLQNIITLFNLNTQQVKGLKKDIEEKEKNQITIDFENDGRVLEEVNKSIQFLIDKKYDLQKINKESFSDNEYKILSNKVLSNITSLPIDVESRSLKLQNIDLAYNGIDGDENAKGIVVYFDNINNIKLISEQLGNYKELLKLSFEIENNTKLIKGKEIKRVELKKIKEGFNDYLIIAEKVKHANDLISKLTKTNSNISSNDLVELKKNEDQADGEINKVKTELNSIENKIKSIEPTKKRIAEIDSLIKEFESVSLLDKTILTKKKESEDLRIIIEDLIKLSEKAKENITLVIDDGKIDISKEYLAELKALIKNSKSVENELSKVKELVESQNIFHNELQDFIAKGLDLVVKNKSNSCPLCSQDYDSFIELSEKITNNESLDIALKKVLEKKADLDSKLASVNDKIQEKKEFILDNIQKTIDNSNEKSDKLLKEISQLLTKLNQIEKLKNERKELALLFEGKDYKDFISKTESRKKSISKELINKNKNKETIVLKTKELQNSIDSNTKKIEVQKKEIVNLKLDKKYKSTIEYFNAILNSNLIELKLIDQNLDEIQVKIDELRKQKQKLMEGIASINKVLKIDDISQDDIKKSIKIQEKSLLICEKATQNYEHFLKSTYNLDVKSTNNKEANILFDNLKKKVKKERQVLEEILKHYRIIEELKEQSRSFLVAVQTKSEIAKFKSQLNDIIKLKKNLEIEKKQLQAYLKKKINDFFYTDLINKIYQKIDPHPDYEKIKFDCEFKDANPRLQIYTKDKQGNFSVPALYFSSAQINILSLSIFLARALKAANPKTGEPIKCIFIDDPIQSMDSINILSFIDLFRSIVVNLDRQIIISTHEENFHLLLQKKIPKNLFKSKFIEFETFGKLSKT